MLVIGAPEEHAGVVLQDIVTTEALEQVRPEWSRLCGDCPDATPFQSPEWLIGWWRHLGDGRLLTLAAREGGRLTALLPAYVHTEPSTGTRRLFLLGMGTSDYLGPLVAPFASGHAATALLERLCALADRWDQCVFSDLEERSGLLAAPLPPGWAERRSTCAACPRLRLPRSDQAFEAMLPSALARNLRYYRRRAEREGPVAWESADERSLPEILSALLRLHEARWRARGGAGVLADERVRRAHLASAPELLRAGSLRLYALRIGGRIVAAHYGLADPPRHERRAYYYLGGWDPRFAHCSPGTLLVEHAIREAIREGMDVFDFARGQEAYKYAWGATDVLTYRRVVCREGAA